MKTSLRYRITIQQLDENENWIDYKTVWAGVSNLFGNDYFAAAAVQAEKTVKFIIRYCKDIDETMRIIFQGKVYNITFVDDIKYTHNFIEIKAIEIPQ